MRFLLFIIIAFTPFFSHAEDQVYIREYLYKASDLDSKVSSRNNTLQLIKSSVLEEIVSFVSSDSELRQAQKAEGFHQDFILKASSKSAGFVQARVLDERWDGFEFWMKAEVRADPVLIRRELEAALQQHNIRQSEITSTPLKQPAQQQTPIAQVAQPEQALPVNTTPDYSPFMRKAQLAQVMVLISPIKLTMTDYYMQNGEWPSSLQDLRLKPNDMNDGQYVEGVQLYKGGRLVTRLGKPFGQQRYLELIPKNIMGGMATRWDCNTNVDLSGMARGSLNCEQVDHIVLQ